MKLKFYLLTALFLISLGFSAQAQLNCNYRLEMYDSFGDGWNGANIDVNVGGTVTNYTVDFADNNGDFNIVEFSVTDGATLALTYEGGTFENEVTYFLYDSDDNVVFQDGPFPGTGLVFEGTASCPTCPSLNEDTFTFTPTADGAVVTWEEGQVAGSYIVEYGPFGFEPGTGTTETVTTNSITITGQEENALLEVYVVLDCGGGDVSSATDGIFVQAGSVNPPVECNFTVELLAGDGFGWGGASIDIGVNNVFTNYTVAFNDNDGDFLLVDLPISSGQLVTLDYNPDNFDPDVSFRLLSPEGIVVFDSGLDPDAGIAFEEAVFCPTCPAIDSESIEVVSAPGGFTVTWDEGQLPGDYIIEYGPLNFEQGTGTTTVVTDNSFTLDGQTEGEYFEVYIALDCGGGDVAFAIGPVLAQAGFTNPPLECFYTLEMYDSFGDGWNGAELIITNGIFTETYTVTNNDNGGDFLFVDIPVTDGNLFTVTYGSGTFDGEVTYFIFDSDGNEVFSDGPNPVVGLAFEGIASCPTCPGIFEDSVEYTQTPDGAIITWEEGQVDGDYIVEYGPFGFEPGTGTTEIVSDNMLTLTGFDEGTILQVYITLDCGDGDISSETDPIFVQTGFTETPLECLYTLQLFAANGFGWGGANIDVIINDGEATNYTVAFNDNDGDFNFVSFPVTSGSLLTIDYNADNFDTDNSFILLDADGQTLYQSGADPTDGINFQEVVSCPACPLPFPDSFTADPLEATSATLSWSEVSSVDMFTVQYGENCFDPETEGETIMTADNSVDLTDLEPGTLYTYYVSGDCGADGVSSTAGPYFFQTPPLCFPPVEAALGEPTSDGVNIFFTPDPNVDEYIFEYGPAGFALGGGTQSGIITGSEGDLINLLSNTDYDVYIYGNCDGDLSAAFGPLSFSTVLPCPAPTEVEAGEVTENTVTVSWAPVAEALNYTVEYGPAGYTPGTGISVETATNNITLEGLNLGVEYDIYVYTNCGNGDGQSLASEATTALIPGAASCTYTLEMFDSFGDGWNGAGLVLEYGTFSETFTVNFNDNNGDFNIVTFTVPPGATFTLTYEPGFFEGEVTYFIYDITGALIFEDGPNPTVGEVLSGQCSDCAVFDTEVSNVTSTTADVTFSATEAAESFVVEWGPVGFTLGTGTSTITTDTTFTITGLTANTNYNVYVTPDCNNPDADIAIGGPVAFTTYLVTDVGIGGFASPMVLGCFTEGDSLPISVLIQNFGDAPQQLIPFFYSFEFMTEVDAGDNPIDGLFTGVVSKDSTEVIDFDDKLFFPEPGYYYFQAWTELEGDENPANDTFTFEFITAYPLPLFEDFNGITDETGLPDGWSSPDGVPVLEPGENPHGLTSNVFGEFLFDGFNSVDTVRMTTARYGPVESSSELSFDYRFVRTDFDNNVFPYILDADDYLRVDVSTDCGETFEELITIEGNDFTTTFFKNVSVSLEEYAGEALTFYFEASNSTTGDFFIDVDNINIAGCPDDLVLQIDQSDPASFGTGNGTLFVQPTFGIAPFTFEWSNGQTTALAEGLGFTDYSVTVTDAQGCTSERIFQPMLTDTEEAPFADFAEVKLFPNPTQGAAQLSVTLDAAEDTEVRIFDLTGRHLRTYTQMNVQSATFNLDLQDEPNGMYLVRVKAGDAVKVMKLAVAR